MPTPVAITPIYNSGDLAKILEAEQFQVEDTVADLTEEQMVWRPNEKAKSALDIIWHLGYQARREKPANKGEALAAFQADHKRLQEMIATPGKLDEKMTWWNGAEITLRGFVWGMIRHRAYHLGELVYLRQTMGVDEPKYYHER